MVSFVSLAGTGIVVGLVDGSTRTDGEAEGSGFTDGVAEATIGGSREG